MKPESATEKPACVIARQAGSCAKCGESLYGLGHAQLNIPGPAVYCSQCCGCRPTGPTRVRNRMECER